MKKILNQCPVCGSRLEYHGLNQYTNVYLILRSGELSKRRIRKTDDGSLECGFIRCVNSDCDFQTDCDLDLYNVKYSKKFRIYDSADGYMIEFKEEAE